MSNLKTLPGVNEIVVDRSGVVLEIGLLLSDENRKRKDLKLAGLRKAAEG
jgi:hypothetical protein